MRWENVKIYARVMRDIRKLIFRTFRFIKCVPHLFSNRNFKTTVSLDKILGYHCDKKGSISDRKKQHFSRCSEVDWIHSGIILSWVKLLNLPNSQFLHLLNKKLGVSSIYIKWFCEYQSITWYLEEIQLMVDTQWTVITAHSIHPNGHSFS